MTQLEIPLPTPFKNNLELDLDDDDDDGKKPLLHSENVFGESVAKLMILGNDPQRSSSTE